MAQNLPKIDNGTSSNLKTRAASPLPRSAQGLTQVALAAIVAVLMLIVLGGLLAWQSHNRELSRRHQAQTEAIKAETEALERAWAKEQEEKAMLERQRAERDRGLFDKTSSALTAQYRKWQDASRLAGSTARIALSAPVASMQAIRRDTEALIVPPCLDYAKSSLLTGMSKEIDAFVIFMQNPANMGDLLAHRPFQEAKSAFSSYEGALGLCNVN